MTPVEILEEWTSSNLLPGASLLIQQKGKVILEHACGYADLKRKTPATVDHIWVTASLAKPVAATALMQMVDSRMVDLDQPVRDLLPEFQHGSVRVRHLLTHTSGLGAMEPESEFIHRLGRIQAIGADRLLFEPGTKCSYSTPALDLVEAIVCRRTDMSWTEYTRTKIFEPLGMIRSTYSPPESWEERIAAVYDETDRVDPWWNNRDLRAIGLAGGGLFSHLRDLAAFGSAFLGAENSILSSKSMQEMITLQTPGLFNLEGQPQTWGLSWYLNQDGGGGFGPLSNRAFGHGGITGTWLCIDPARDLIVVKLANRLHIPLDLTIQMQSRLLHSILEFLPE